MTKTIAPTGNIEKTASVGFSGPARTSSLGRFDNPGLDRAKTSMASEHRTPVYTATGLAGRISGVDRTVTSSAGAFTA